MAHNGAATPLDRLSTGSPELDEILGGGLPARSVNVIAGDPGTGKTVFALQMLFHLARQGKKCLYFTTLSEPAIKVIRYLQAFPFFDEVLIDDRVVFADLGSTLRQSAETALAEVAARVERDQPDVVAIDSFKALHDLLSEARRGRVLIYDLAVQMAGWGATTLLIGEYAPHEAATHAEFAIADGIIRFINEPMELTSVRMIEVLKLRGTNYLTGRHFFEIGPDGLSFYPRIRPPQLTVGAQTPTDRVPTGVEGLDELLGGGLPRASATLVEGGTGTGKTLLGLTFLMEGARRGEPGLLLTLEETPEQLRWVASGVGWDLATLEAQGLLSLIYTSPVELSPDRFLYEARRHVETLGVRRVVLDSLTALFVGVPSERRYKELVYSLTKHLRRLGVTLLTTMEVAELLGAAQITGRGISSITDNAILLRYVEMGGHLERAICVIKARGVKHQMELRRLVIDSDGVHFGPPFTDLRGVLTGMPVPVDNAPGPI